MNVYAALERHDSEHRNYLIVGPWNHGSWRGNSTRLGLVDFGSDTAQYARQNLSDPWLNYHLGLSNELRIAGATVFETGTNHWRRYDSWPPEEITTACRLYLGANQELTFDAPRSSSGYDEYITDPAHPVPYVRRPIKPTFQDYSKPIVERTDWPEWLVQDQRFLSARADVRSWTTKPLTSDLHPVGDVAADLYASTSGTDSDGVVRLIDVYPDDDRDPNMRGFELIIAGEIFRARYRNSFGRVKF